MFPLLPSTGVGECYCESLPQVIVCGDQSSGKSSIVEAISGVSFPIKSNLCTRFLTKLVLRKTSHSRSDSEQLSLKGRAAMAISTHGRAISTDLLRVEVSGPDRPHLTIVDLPGLIYSETKQQSASDVEEPRSIILVVVLVKNDYANQIVLKLAHAAYKKGTRTLSVIIKPNTLIPERLSRVLLLQIAAELPSLISKIDIKFDACRSRLEKLGEPRATLEEQQLYLLHISQLFQSLVKAAVDGTYNDPFFEDPTSEVGYHKRLRAWIQNLNLDFIEDITRRGHWRKLTDSSCSNLGSRGQILTIRIQYVDHIQRLIQEDKGPGALLQNVFNPSLNQLLRDLKDKTRELLVPYQSGYPITYNHYFTETLQKVRNEWTKDEYTRIIQGFFGVSSLDSVYYGGYRDLRPLVTALLQHREPDVNRHAYSKALDCMEAYYKVALKRFIDDVAVEVVEIKLVSKLYDIFSPITVISVFANLVIAITGESEEN
ncbi:hypothetical protein K469DRAFT_760882 [Zopfia rhizophila CBS 207.26]|uniref:GED domain-containing protein n=1 Tax=Zopfia rhizophila CBS 207.26 TaxID=1314779 RepID=A0A6A6DCP8_9PEZI|nr:hypothetical protein K469DRAFT_760882 [Zopfia rhizophila CBS 207.26]